MSAAGVAVRIGWRWSAVVGVVRRCDGCDGRAVVLDWSATVGGSDRLAMVGVVRCCRCRRSGSDGVKVSAVVGVAMVAATVGGWRCDGFGCV